MVRKFSTRGRMALAAVVVGILGVGATAGIVAWAAGTPTLVKGTQLGSLGWYTNNYATGVGPMGVVFDGTYLWTSNYSGNSVTRISPTTGAGTTFALPSGAVQPVGIAFDGTYIWTANSLTNNVTRITPSTGAGTNYALPSGAISPRGVVFDGTNIWTSNSGTSAVSKVNASTGAVVGTYALPAYSNPVSVAYDGAYIWTEIGRAHV